MQELAAKISDISLKAERMDRFVRLLLQEQAKMEEEIEKLELEKAQILLEKKQLADKKGGGNAKKLQEEIAFLQAENQKLQGENEALKNKQLENVAMRAVDIEAQDAMKIKIDTYIKEIDDCLKIFDD